jgi:lariat debranching enzyme
MSAPARFREIGDFHEYYSRARVAPYLTIFVGGNHEASNYLWELYYGGWVAPNIYYMGAANVLRLGPLRIAGLSGIWKGYNYNKPHHERLPYNSDDVKSIYHVRELDVRKLLQIQTQIDIGISHDWPRGIEWLGNHKALFAVKDLFEADAKAGTLGSAAARNVLDRLRPPWWFAAHLHVKFAALVNHEVVLDSTEISNGASAEALEKPHNEDEIDLDLDMDDAPEEDVKVVDQVEKLQGASKDGLSLEEATNTSGIMESLRSQLPASFLPKPPPETELPAPLPKDISNTATRFLALDKCLPHRKFLQLLEIEPYEKSSNSQRPYFLNYDEEWLAITKAFASELQLGGNSRVPQRKRHEQYTKDVQISRKWIASNIQSGQWRIPDNFALTAPGHDVEEDIRHPKMPQEYSNPQTTAYCNLLGIENKFHATEGERAERMARGPVPEAPRTNSYGGHGGFRGNGRGRGGRGQGRGGHRGRGRGRGQ